MKLNTKEDIEAPQEFVFAALSDFEGWERAAMRRGVDVVRSDRLTKPGPGMGWKAQFPFRRKQRCVEIELKRMEPVQLLDFGVQSPATEGILMLELVEMGARRTRVSVVVDIRPRTMAARLFIQSLRLVKAKVKRKFELRVAQLGADIEDRYRAQLRG